MNFPLFDIILGEIDTTGDIDKNKLCERIKKLDDEGYELMYALMKCYAQRFHDDYTSPPFQGKKCKGGYKFDISILPDQLMRILYHFVIKHHEKMKEENLRSNGILDNMDGLEAIV